MKDKKQIHNKVEEVALYIILILQACLIIMGLRVLKLGGSRLAYDQKIYLINVIIIAVIMSILLVIRLIVLKKRKKAKQNHLNLN